MEEVTSVKQCLLLYERAAGQRINFLKSAVSFGLGVSEELKVRIQDFLGVSFVPFHERYLGLPTVAGKSKKLMFKRINDRLEAHMCGWQSKFLSKAGKLVLVKAVVQAIPTYAMNVFRLPKGVCRSFQLKVSKYWWGDGKGKKGIHWGSWSLLCRNKKFGGLGFRDVQDFNQALLAKTVWCIATNLESLVHKMLQAKYFPDSNWVGARCCPGVSMIWSSLLWGLDLLVNGLRWRVISNGESIRVWGDKWIPVPWNFQVVSPLSGYPNLRVRDLFNQYRMWNVPLIQSLFLTREAEMILSIPLTGARQPDTIVWHYEKNGIYSVKSGVWLAWELKNKEAGSPGGSGGFNKMPTVWDKLWGLNVVAKIKIFLWRPCHNFLPCTFNLKSRHMKVDEKCFRCGGPREDIVHCLWECRFAKAVWKHSFLADACRVWRETCFTGLFDHVSKVASQNELALFGVMAWLILKNRNACRFGEKATTGEQIVLQAKEWLSNFHGANSRSASILSSAPSIMSSIPAPSSCTNDQ